jgi:hypothetical protein
LLDPRKWVRPRTQRPQGQTNFESGFCAFAGRRKPLHFIEQVALNEHDAKIIQLHILARKGTQFGNEQPPKQPPESE